MGIHEYLCRLEKKLDAEYKESSAIAKILQRHSPTMIAAGLVIAAVSAPFIGFLYSSAKADYEQRVKQEALQYESKCKQELGRQKAVLDSEWRQIEEKKEELCQKETDLGYKAMEVDSAARIAEFDGKYLKIKEQIIDAKKDILARQLDKREQALQEAEQKIERMMFNHAKGSLPFYR